MTKPSDITSLLVSPNPRVRLEAVQSFERSAPDADALPALGAALGDNDRRVCEAAIEALISYPGVASLKILMLSLADERDWLRDAVDNALSRIDSRWETTPAAQAFIDEFCLNLAFLDSPLHQKAADAVRRPHDQLAAKKLRDGIIEFGAESLALILERRDDASELTPILRLLTSGDPPHRKLAFETLNLLNPFWTESEAAQALLADLAADLKSPDALMRTATMEVFAAIAGPESAPTLIDSLVDEGHIRVAAEVALDRIDPEWTQRPEIGPLTRTCIQRLQAPEPTVRFSALETLKRIGSESLAPQIAKALIDENPRIRREASACLEKLAPDWKRNKLAKQAVPIAISALSHANEDVRRDAQRLLGEIGGRPAVKALIDQLAATPEAGLMKALGSIRDSRAIAPLVSALLHGSSFLHRHAVAALESIDPAWPDSEAVREMKPAFLRELREAETPDTRAAAARALGEVGGEDALDPLRAAAAGDQSPDVRRDAGRASERLRQRLREAKSKTSA